MDIFLFSLVGFIASVGLFFLSLWLFPKLGLLDFPERYGLNRVRLPYPGGLIFVLLILAMAFFLPQFWGIWIALFVLSVLSFIDDRKRVPTWIRLFFHIAIAVFVFWAGIRIGFVGNPFSRGESFDLTQLSWLSLVLTVGWIVVIQNAMNWFDAIRGLTVGVSGIGFFALGVFGLIRQEVLWEAHLHSSLLLSFYLFALCAGAFLFFWRGKIILGDTGSQILGFLLAILSLLAGTKIATTLLVLALPILDSVFVVFRRIFLEKKSPFSNDKYHLPHFLSVKIGESNTTLFLVFLTTLLGSIAVFLTGVLKLAAFGVVVIFVFGLSFWSYKKR